MRHRWFALARRIVPVLGMGMLMQGGGCALDTNALTAGLATYIANSLISSLVFGSFNLVGP